MLRESGLLRGKTVGVDSTTLEANAAMRAIVRRDDGTEYDAWLEQLAKASGIETPTRQDLAKTDRKRPRKGSNKDWKHPDDPDARITKMKDGRTRLAHKLEQAVDMETGAVVATTVQTMDRGVTASLPNTLDEAERRLAARSVAIIRQLSHRPGLQAHSPLETGPAFRLTCVGQDSRLTEMTSCPTLQGPLYSSGREFPELRVPIPSKNPYNPLWRGAS